MLSIFYWLFTSRHMEDLKTLQLGGQVRSKNEYILCLSGVFQKTFTWLVGWIL